MLWAYYAPEQVTFTHRDQVATYARNAPVPGQFKVGLNARLFDDFNLDAVRVKFVDGRNLW